MSGQSAILSLPHFFQSSKRKKNYFTEFYMDLTDKISVIKEKTVMSFKVLIKEWKIKSLEYIQRECEKRNCRYLIF